MNLALLKLIGKMAGGPQRIKPAGMSNAVKFLEQIILSNKVPASKKKLAQRLLSNIRDGGPRVPFTSDSDFRLIKNLGANIDDAIAWGPNRNNIIRREMMINPYQEKAGIGYYLGMKKVPMIDVDLPIGPRAHTAYQMHHGWKTRSDFMNHFSNFLKTDAAKSHTFRLYETPGGYRLFDVGAKMRNRGTQHYLDTGVPRMLGQDRAYTNNLSSGYFFSRLNPKPGRPGDYVARLKGTYGSGGLNAKSEWDVIARHDNTIEMINDAARAGNFDALGGWFRFMKEAL